MMPSSALTSSKDAQDSYFCFCGQQQLEGICEAFQKHHIDQQCNENKPFKDIHKDTPFKLGLSHLLKVIQR
jgi:hypothetical protein